MNLILQSIVGYIGLLGIAWLICKDKSHIQWRTVICGALLQWVLALLILKLPAAQTLFASFNQLMLSIEQATREGTSLVFGYLGGAAPPFTVNAGSSTFILAFQALPIVLVLSALSALLFYWRVLPWLVSHMSTLLERVLGHGTGSEQIDIESDYSAMSAVYRGTAEGLQLLLNIIACLIVAVALLSIINQLLAWIPHEGTAWSLQRLLGLLLMPIAWLAGIPWAEAGTAGALLGTKTILNELVAYIDLSRLPAESLSPHSRLIMTYALCGFANIGSLGIMIGGLTTMIPSRRQDILELAPKTLLSGTLATLSCGAVVGFIDLLSHS